MLIEALQGHDNDQKIRQDAMIGAATVLPKKENQMREGVGST